MLDLFLQTAFLTQFGRPPSHQVEAPGRVNLIGDHTDYNHLPVLPMAIRQRVRLVLAPRDDRIVRVVSLGTGFDPTSFELGDNIPRESDGHWSNYVRGAAQTVARLKGSAVRGFDALLTSDIPVAAGLSSSSALVVSIVLAVLECARSDPNEPPLEGSPGSSVFDIVALAAKGERYVGTEGGWMDQAASVYAEAGHALYIQFAPFQVSPIPVPDSWRFVVVHSGVVAEKSGARAADYNQRVEQCREALRRMTGSAGLTPTARYRDLLERTPVGELVRLAEANLSGVELKRFRHTVTEAARVEAAVGALEDEDAIRFGALMNASHQSLARDYEVSTPLLDEMVAAALANGAFGARLTGAGFGGAVVALVPQPAIGTVVAALDSCVAATHEGGQAAAFVAIASEGARVRRWTDDPSPT